ncbi:MAG: GNAT family N-acetyltransferase [Actinomycetota bacterium]|nr:GNAT family N-acetyltransferase [Actinomycetota bacterium]
MTDATEQLVLRPVTAAEYAAWFSAVVRQFGGDVHDEDVAASRAFMELDRTLAVFDRDEIVATAAVLGFTMTLPGGRQVPCAGVTDVGVRTTHRRRGLLRRMMRRQLADVHDRGEPLAALLASESGIYGRFGYGPSTPTLNLAIDSPWARLDRPVEPGGIRLVDARTALARCPAIHAQVQRTQPGMLSRSPAHWQLWLGRDPEHYRDGYTARYHALFGDRGYVVYRLKDDWRDNAPAGRLRVLELVAADPEAAAALWQYCFSVDLVATVEAELRPADEPLVHLLAEPTRLRVTAGEPLYTRLVSVPDALRARSYAAAGSLVLDVRDDACPWNTGRWRLEATPDGATCEATRDTADVTLDVVELGTAYLGGVRLARLARARRLEAHTAGALATADAMFATEPLPWNSFSF